MTPGMKMMMIDRARRSETENRYRYDGGMENRGGRKVEIEYEDTRDSMSPENRNQRRYRDGRFPPRREGGSMEMGGEMGYEIEDRFRDRRGREHYDNGRFAPMRSRMNDGPYDRMENGGYKQRMAENRWVPPIHEGTGYRYEDGSRMIGFYGGREVENGGYRSEARYESRDEMAHNRSPKMAGHAEALSKTMDRETAREWVKHMKNADGSTGEHWSYEQTTQVMKQRGIDCNPAEWYAIMNAVWSDYGKIAEKYGVNNVDFWADFTKAWLMDKDAHADKAALYYECIVK